MAEILLLDDNAAFRDVVADVLREAGHAVRVAGDGRSVASVLRTQPIDLVITDLVMPERDGLETIRLLRREFPGLPVLAMSGDFPDSAVVCLEMAGRLGARKLLQKPFSADVLLAAVDEMLVRRRAN